MGSIVLLVVSRFVLRVVLAVMISVCRHALTMPGFLVVVVRCRCRCAPGFGCWFVLLLLVRVAVAVVLVLVWFHCCMLGSSLSFARSFVHRWFRVFIVRK